MGDVGDPGLPSQGLAKENPEPSHDTSILGERGLSRAVSFQFSKHIRDEPRETDLGL